MKRTQVLVSQLPGFPDPLPVAAACRAGATGILDGLWLSDQAVIRCRERLQALAGTPAGLRLAASRAGLIDTLLDQGDQAIDTLVLTGPFPPDTADTVTRIAPRVGQVLVECLDEEDLRLAQRSGAGGVIVRGNEAGGLVAAESSFILLQRFLAATSLPVYVQGGIGPHSAAACMAAGAAGVVLDGQCALARESSLPDHLKKHFSSFDGTQTGCPELGHGHGLRVLSRINRAAAGEFLRRVEARAAESPGWPQLRDVLSSLLATAASPEAGAGRVFPLGQDIALAAPLAERFVTVAGIVSGICDQVNRLPADLDASAILGENTPLARSHRTRYPIVQGPMARISDSPAFALAVAEAGGLPFLAAAMLGGNELERIVTATANTLGSRPWGVGLLGFLPSDRYREQVRILLAHRPPFALIAGGRPEQARALEAEGIATYLHVPTPGLLRMFLKAGARRFVFEGREAGGHVAPLASFVLWEQMLLLLGDFLARRKGEAEELHLLFAGGIHDGLSAAMVAALAAPLAGQGVRIGLQLGSVYLFTEEIVATGALEKQYRDMVLAGERTVLLETGLGHASRCVPTPFADEFLRRRQELRSRGLGEREIRDRLELLNLGKLRLAAKGVDRPAADSRAEPVRVSEKEQRRQGLYMVGQLGTLRRQVVSVADVHRSVIDDGRSRLEEYRARHGGRPPAPRSRPADIAIIGMASILPGAPSVRRYWHNILSRVNAVTEVPPERWDWRLYYDEDQDAEDRCYSRWGAFIDETVFDPVSWGMPPASIPFIEPLQLLALEMARQALVDAGYDRRPFSRERTSVILGISGAGELGQLYSFRAALPMFLGEAARRVTDHFHDRLPRWSEDTFPGILTNVTAGRIANRLDLGGTNYTVDAACASSLAALYLAVMELEAGRSRMALVGAADCLQNPFAYLCFSKTRALSPRGQCRTFDRDADGIALGEGVAMLVLKRLADAEADGDRIHAVIRSVGASSDGRDRSLTAPRREGQLVAFERAYGRAGFSPATVGLVEAHGTGTVLGDQVELEALTALLRSAGAPPRSVAVGSVKSMIGHTKSTAGIAGLIKATLALRDRILPPTMGVEQPNRVLEDDDSPLFLNTTARPWLNGHRDLPRRAGVSALGFGGTNFHVVLEEYRNSLVPQRQRPLLGFAAELYLFRAASADELRTTLAAWRQWLARHPDVDPACLALGAWQAAQTTDDARRCLAVVAASTRELAQLLAEAGEHLATDAEIRDPRGIYHAPRPLAAGGAVAFLFPGQGSQYVNMLADLAIQFPEVHDLFERAVFLLRDRLEEPLSAVLYPWSAFRPDEEKRQAKALARTRYAQPAMGAADLAIFDLLGACNVRPDMAGGHSYGEYAALCAAGVMGRDDLIRLSEARGRFIVESAEPEPGTMAAVKADREQVARILANRPHVWIANLNAPDQTIISGHGRAVEEAVRDFGSAGIAARTIPVACAFHSPVVAGAVDRLHEFLADVELGEPRFPVYSNRTAASYPADRSAVIDLLGEHLVHGVEFIRQIEAMYDAGARLFVESGPGRVLSNLVASILGDRPHLAVPANLPGRSGMVGLLHCLGHLAAHGVPVDLVPLFQGRDLEPVSPGIPERDTGYPAAAWLVSGGRARPCSGADQPPAPVRPMEPGRLWPADGESGAATRSAGLPAAGPVNMPPAGAGDRDRVFAGYQRLMQTFLETQAGVMKAWLGDSRSTEQESSGREPVPVPLPREAEKCHVPEAVAGAPPPGDVRTVLLAIVSDRTGYPVEMLSLDADLEGELGIDSIKRVEILGVLVGELFAGDREAAAEASSELATCRSLGAIIDRAGEILARKGAPDDGRIVPGKETASAGEAADPKELLLGIVADRTGYPVGMLSPDADLEGELGIDSIKRVEILGAFADALRAAGPLDGEALERMGQARTLAAILACLDPVPDRQEGEDSGEPLPRFLLTSRSCPLQEPLLQKVPTRGWILVTDDGQGRATELAGLIAGQGGRVEILATADMKEAELRQRIQALRQVHGPANGLVHLAPLAAGPSYDDLDLAGWRARIRQESEVLFHLLQELAVDLAGADDGVILAATAMGGCFGIEGGADFMPCQGGVCGLLKTVAAEWPGVRVRCVDLDPGLGPQAMLDAVWAELRCAGDEVEVGWTDRGRCRPVLEARPLPAEADLALDTPSVILVTGGARGITAAAALELARRHRPTLILVGSSPLPPEREDETTVGLDEAGIKAALVARMKDDDGRVRLPEVERACRAVLKEREIRANIAAMRAAGARVIYRQADVRRQEEFVTLLDELYDEFGGIHGVIHGAGIIEDKLLVDKPAESFRRVVSTKADSVFLLARALRPDSLRFLVLFSSVAGRFGNPGQCDYTAANEIVNKTARLLDRRWPCRVVAINWGPWAKEGMVSPALERQFAERGVRLIEPADGVAMLMAEIFRGRKGEVEVTVGDGPWGAIAGDGEENT